MHMKLPSSETTKSLNDLASLGQKLILSLGVFVLFCYCFSEQIMPDGLSLGDAVVLIMAALSFGLVMLVGTVYGMTAGVCIVQAMVLIANALKKENKVSLAKMWQGKSMMVMSIILLIVLVLFVVVGHYMNAAGDMKLEQTVLCFIAIGMLLICALGIKREEEKPRTLTANIFIGALVTFTPLLVFHPAVMNITMITLGIRSVPGSLIVVDASAYPKVQEVIERSGLNINFCRLQGSGSWATTDARAVWHGVGATSFVSFMEPSPEGAPVKSVSTYIPKDSLHVFRPSNEKFSCDKQAVASSKKQ
jgi:MFS family permease